MDYVEKSMKDCGFTVTPETIFKYYLAFLESIEQEHHKRSKSHRSSGSSDDGKRHRKKPKIE